MHRLVFVDIRPDGLAKIVQPDRLVYDGDGPEDKPVEVRREMPACEIAWPRSTTSVSVTAKNRH
jgi:hypothetical protein